MVDPVMEGSSAASPLIEPIIPVIIACAAALSAMESVNSAQRLIPQCFYSDDVMFAVSQDKKLEQEALRLEATVLYRQSSNGC
ncbi:hypothetical protein ACQJBY_067591 [Aegilops geniculata]